MPPSAHAATFAENVTSQPTAKPDTSSKEPQSKQNGIEGSKATKKVKTEPAQSSVSATVCSNCGTTTTPLWRRAPNGDTICNACGLYLKARNTLRPVSLKRFHAKKSEATNDCGSGSGVASGSCPGGGHCNGTGGSSSCAGCPAFNQHQVNRTALVCANCQTTTTPLWRRDEANNTICNACGLYYKLHNVHRPVTMKRSTIKRRKRVAVTTASEKGTDDEEEHDDLESESAMSIEDANHETQSHSDRAATEEEESDHSTARKQARIHAGKKVKRIRKADRANDKAPSAHVPAIEDYIVPKRLPGSTEYRIPSTASQYSDNSRDVHHHQTLDSRHSTSPFSGHSRALDTRLIRLPHEHQASSMRSVSPFSAPFSDKHFSTLPPVSSERRSSHGIASLLNPTPNTESQRSPHLPPISLPPLTPPNTISSHNAGNPPVSHLSPPQRELSSPSKFPSLLTSAFRSTVDHPDLTSESEAELIKHKKELQEEITNLGLLLSKRTQMLSTIDSALTSQKRSQLSDINRDNRT
ncbi:Suppressor of ferric uptake 1 [Umbelopsis sp. WA50703]